MRCLTVIDVTGVTWSHILPSFSFSALLDFTWLDSFCLNTPWSQTLIIVGVCLSNFTISHLFFFFILFVVCNVSHNYVEMFQQTKSPGSFNRCVGWTVDVKRLHYLKLLCMTGNSALCALKWIPGTRPYEKIISFLASVAYSKPVHKPRNNQFLDQFVRY